MKITDKLVLFFSNKDILSNFYPCTIMHNGLKFHCSEQLFMYLKAKLFLDEDSAEKILKCKTSKEAKDLGRGVKNFKSDTWDLWKYQIMYKALFVKAEYCQEFKDLLIQYKDKTFVECNPHDTIWAIGLSEDNDQILDPKNWKGKNLLGEVLTELANKL